MKSLAFLFSFLFYFSAGAEEEFAVDRLAVFPLHSSTSLQKISEDAWWTIRNELTKNRQFLVASRRFMENKDVLQPRKSLQPADAIILGRLLDAQALVVTNIKETTMELMVYGAERGTLLWKRDLSFDPDIPKKDQVKLMSTKLIRSFAAEVPYQGRVLPASDGEATFEQGDILLTKVKLPTHHQLEMGSAAQFLRLSSRGQKPLLQGGATWEVYAEGRVIELDRQNVTVEILRQESDGKVMVGALARFPSEQERLLAKHALVKSPENQLREEIKRATLVDEVSEKEEGPLLTALAFIGNMALFILLAL